MSQFRNKKSSNKLFIWIPKNAGTSMYHKMQYEHEMKLLIENYYLFNNKGSVSFGHASPRALLQRGVISNEYWQQADKFCIVRNPYTRFVSLFHDMQRTNRIHPKTTMVAFAHMLQHMTREIGLFNTKDYSQCAAQVSWIVPGVRILRFEELDFDDLPAHNTGGYIKYPLSSELRSVVYALYREDFAILNYDK